MKKLTVEEKLKQHIRRLVREVLKEISTSDGAGAFLTKGAFRGNRVGSRARQKKNAEQLGYKLTPQGEKEANRKADILESSGPMVQVPVSKVQYHQYREDTSSAPHQKIGKSIAQLNQELCEIERVLKMNSRLKTEYGITSERLWKRTQKGLVKLESNLLAIAGRIKEIRGDA
jgi:hypothetical protein